MRRFDKLSDVTIRVNPIPRGCDSKNDSKRKEQSAYYIQIHTCPSQECGCEIMTCSCPSFQVQKPSRGVDAFHDPCKHIKELQFLGVGTVIGFEDQEEE